MRPYSMMRKTYSLLYRPVVLAQTSSIGRAAVAEAHCVLLLSLHQNGKWTIREH
jgi:hypothetical protein